MPIASLRLSVSICLLVATGALAADSQSRLLQLDAPLRIEIALSQSEQKSGSTPISEMSEPQLRDEIARVEGAQLSKRLYIPGVILGVGGTLAAAMAGLINVDVRKCPGKVIGLNINCNGPNHQTNPLTAPLLGAAAAGVVLGVGIVIVVTALRHRLGPRLDFLNLALNHFEELRQPPEEQGIDVDKVGQSPERPGARTGATQL